MVIAFGTALLEQVQILRIQTSREGISVNREIQEVEAERQRTEEKKQADLRILQLEESLAAQEIRSSSFLGGIVSVAAPALAGAFGIVAGSVFGGFGAAPLATAVQAAVTKLLSAVPSAMIMGGLAGAVGAVVALHKDNNASEAALGVSESEQAVAESENRKGQADGSVEDTSKERARARQGLRRGRDEVRETQQTIGAQLRGRGADGTLRVPGGAMAKVTSLRLETALLEEQGANQDLREARGDALELRQEAIALRRKATEEEIAQRERKAWLGLAQAVVEVGAMVATAGASGAVNVGVNIAQAGMKAASILGSPEEARAETRAAEDKEALAKRRDRDGDLAQAQKRSVAKDRDRALDAATALGQAQKVQVGGVMSGFTINYAEIAKVRAQVAMEEARDGRRDLKVARDEELQAEQQAIDHRRSGDSELAADESRDDVFAAIGAGVSLVGALAGVAQLDEALKGINQTLKAVEVGSQAASAGSNAAQAGIKLADDDDSRAFERKADEARLEGKKAAAKISDAEDLRDRSEEDARRTLDAAVAMQRNLTPQLA
ncbi:MAG: hypothetical protein IPG45_04565 [Deltaproteobacteria bacterium]|jgi:hypothetical protein|nr:hypothetical protein [Deltaproteobacteria bacterium]